MPNSKLLYLCGGLQSSGSTLVAWCFLQRPDLDGVLDARNDVLPVLPLVRTPGLFCKITISSFRFSEMIGHYADNGWDVRPLLVVRDVRSVFNSLLSKTYGSNGTTAEEPPLRMRLRRFNEDWKAVAGQCPIIRFERLLERPEETLRQSCAELQLPWDRAMLDWPKDASQIADPGHGSPTFRKSRRESFSDTADRALGDIRVERIPSEDLEWLEREFEEFNQTFDYPAHVRADPDGGGPRALPSWENTRRYRQSRKPMARVLASLVKVRTAIRDSVSPKWGRQPGWRRLALGVQARWDQRGRASGRGADGRPPAA